MDQPLRWIGLLLLLALPAQAGFDDAQALYRAGEFQRAAQIARTLDSADGDAFAARSTLVIAAYLEPDRDRALHLLKVAEADADHALARDAAHIEARLQHAAARGYQARVARSAAQARAVRGEIEAVLAFAPNHPYALAALGGWHGEAIDTVGGLLAGLGVGAKRRGFEAAFEQALALDPDNPAIAVYYARLLLALGGRNYRDRAAEILARATAHSPRDAFERRLIEQAEALKAALAEKNGPRLKTLVRRFTPFSE